ncbi:MAG: hypothetical protein Ct9H300mP11_00270 [Chloroflexota bacterium]|nr:MAG: hypothetical protein Ct9H300mP11_00270 [Chloroflexota bacterium]
MTEIAEFAKSVPDLPIIVNHVGGVSRVGIYADKDDEIIPKWREGITALAANPNVTMKLGGLGIPRVLDSGGTQGKYPSDQKN